jgi:hypothetical protein
MKYTTLLCLLTVYFSSNIVGADMVSSNSIPQKKMKAASLSGGTPILSVLSPTRRLSTWGSILHFLVCPPGPLGNRASCKNGNNGDNGGGNGNGGNNGGGSSRSWSWWNGGSGNNNGGGGDANNNANGAGIASVGSFPWFMMVFSLVGLATAGAYVAYQSVRLRRALRHDNQKEMLPKKSINEQGKASAITLKQKVKAFVNRKRGGSSNNDYKLNQDNGMA